MIHVNAVSCCLMLIGGKSRMGNAKFTDSRPELAHCCKREGRPRQVAVQGSILDLWTPAPYTATSSSDRGDRQRLVCPPLAITLPSCQRPRPACSLPASGFLHVLPSALATRGNSKTALEDLHKLRSWLGRVALRSECASLFLHKFLLLQI